MANIRIRLGVVLDSDLGDTVYRPLVEGSKRAKKAIDANLGGGNGGGGQGPYRGQAEATARVSKQMERDVAKSAKARVALEKAANREIEQDLAQHNKAREAAQRKQDRADSVAARRNQHIADSAALRVSSGAVRGAGNFMRRGAGIASDIARGAGVDVNLQGAVAARSQLEATATDISSSAFMPGSGKAKVDPRALMKQAQDVAIGTGVGSSQDVLAGLQAFVAKTGDLETGRNVLADMARLSAATGSSLSDVVSAAGDVSSNIGDVGKEFATADEKAAAVERTMRMIASGGKLGAVEMRDFASQMAKVASRASEFGGNHEDTVAMLGALAQESRAKGGSASATQAATSVGSFVNTFSKGARRKAFAGQGVQIEDGEGQLLSAKQIILNSLRATGGDKEKMGKLFADSRARSVTRGFESTYHQAGGGQKGLDAVAAEFEKLLQPMLSKEQVGKDADARRQTMQSQATILQEQFNKQLGDAAEKVAPALMKLVPIASRMVESFGGIIGWAASNPLQAAFAGLGASVMKSVATEMMRAGTEKMLGGLVGNVAIRGASGTGPQATGMAAASGMGAGSGMAGLLNFAGATIAITAAAVTLYSAGTALIDAAMSESSKGQADRQREELEGLNATSKLSALRRGGGPLTKEAGETTEMARARQSSENEQAIAAAEAEVRAKRDALVDRQDNGTAYAGMSDSEAFAAKIDAAVQKLFGNGAQAEDMKAGKDAAQNSAEIQSEIQRLNSALTGGTLKVTIVGGLPTGGAPPPGTGRSPQ